MLRRSVASASSFITGARLVSCLMVSWLASAELPAHAQAPMGTAEPGALVAAIQAAHLDVGRAVSLSQQKLNVGPATLQLDGIVVPAVAEGLSPVELVFLGHGRIEMAAPDAIEAAQLELFTGAKRLDTGFTEAVLVVGPDAAVSALLHKPAAQLDAATRQRAESLWTAWRGKREREIFAVDRAILIDALHDPLANGYFGAWFRGGENGSFLYLVQAEDQEQVTLGRFVPLDATEKEKRRIAKELRREQRKGRARGLEVDDLGQWDSWMSATLRDAAGRPFAGTPAFEPTKYTLDVRVSGSDLRLAGTARIDLERVVLGSRVVGLSLPRDFEVTRVTDGAGSDLFFLRSEAELTVVLPPAAAEALAVTVAVDYAGNPIAKDWSLTSLLGTDSWYPRAGLVDRATYDVTFHWPKGYELAAAGRRVAGEQNADGTRWEQRLLDVPGMGFSFEVGHFDIQEATAGHVKVTFAFGPRGAFHSRADRQELIHTVTDSLAYFEEVFGALPFDVMTVSTVPRGFSQGLPTFVTISDLSVDVGVWNRYFGIEDRRLAIAHEVAHQWWGNLVGWTSYRDQWISEAMAEYSAALYGQNRLAGKLEGLESTAGWQDELTDRLANGRPIESLGPVVLGVRLNSSLANDAYRLIVYKKGAVVLNMLANLLGEESFAKALGVVVKSSAGKTVSTADFVALLTRATATDLDGFARQFVYGTGLPKVLYSYRWQKEGSGWAVKGEARQVGSHYYRYRVVRTSDGRLDVVGQPVSLVDLATSALVVPLQIEVLDPAKAKGNGRNGANGIVAGRLFMKGPSTEFSIPSPFEPQGLWLDRKATVFGLFYDESRNPKLAAFMRAVEARADGRAGEAETLFAQALAATDAAPESEHGETVYWEQVRADHRAFDALIETTRAVMLMDLGRDEEADADLSRAQRTVGDDLLLVRIQARLEVRRGRYDKAYRLLQRGNRNEVLDAQDYALLAIAARETGHPEEAEKALSKAKEYGVDVSLLSAPPPSNN